jgi:hypothetical protein
MEALREDSNRVTDNVQEPGPHIAAETVAINAGASSSAWGWLPIPSSLSLASVVDVVKKRSEAVANVYKRYVPNVCLK